MTKRKKKRTRYNIKRRLAILLLLLIILGLAIGTLYYFFLKPRTYDSVKIEAGDEITLDDFVIEDSKDISFVTKVSKIDTTKVGSHDIILSFKGIEKVSILEIVDTIAPTADAVAVTTTKGTLPGANECVTNVEDVTDVTISYKEEPDVSTGGDVTATILLTDEGHNTTEVTTTITVIDDTTPPVIEGATDIDAFIGDSISYRGNLTITDDQDDNPTVTIDNSQVDTNTPGTYPVTVTATDFAGNSTSVTFNVTLSEKPEGYVEESVVLDLANQVLEEITDPDMSKMEVAFEIYKWCRTNINYVDDSDKTCWTMGAYQGFTQKSGDCYTYFSTAKALYEAAGIENCDIEKSVTTYSRHYWSLINLGDGWYHVDCTPRHGEDDLFFMLTDEELEEYSSRHYNSHIFDSSLYPERATVSVQDKVSYTTGQILD